MKNGFKLAPDTNDAKPRMSENSNGAMIVLGATKLSMAGLTASLARHLGRPVVDKTGVTKGLVDVIVVDRVEKPSEN